MKYLLVLLVLLVAWFAWRSGRNEKPGPQERRAVPQPPKPQDMVSCAVCGVHLPQGDAVQGRKAVYCGPEHLQLAER